MPQAQSGERNPNANLTREQVAEIKYLLDEGYGCSWVSNMGYPIEKTGVQMIAQGRRWAGVEPRAPEGW